MSDILMGLVIDVRSKKKGGNPGGEISVNCFNRPQYYYAKHCNHSKVSRKESSFVYTHQPIYEAVTCEMARDLGLKFPDFFIMDNRDKSINFRSNGLKMDINNGKPYYFFSNLLNLGADEPQGNEMIERESIYRDLLQISDITGRRQNYTFFEGNLIYLDVGCTFVDAHEGSIKFRTQHPKLLDKKPLKNSRKRIGRYSLVLLGGSKIDMLDFVDMPRDLYIPVMTSEGDKTSKKLEDLITSDEIDEICNRIVGGIIKKKVLQCNGDSQYLVRNK